MRFYNSVRQYRQTYTNETLEFCRADGTLLQTHSRNTAVIYFANDDNQFRRAAGSRKTALPHRRENRRGRSEVYLAEDTKLEHQIAAISGVPAVIRRYW